MATNLQPYKYITHKPDYYSFITEAGHEYVCYFSPYGEYFEKYPELASKIFDFNLVLKNKKVKSIGVDKRIADTVITIVGDFLNSKINAVVYVCDPSDGKGAARARKFKSWFSYYEHPSFQILQLNTEMQVGGTRIFTALLVHRKNKLKKKFIDAYIELTDVDDDK